MNSSKKLEDEQTERAVVYHLMFEEAFKEAVKRGNEFTNLDAHVDNVGEVEKRARDERAIDNQLRKEMFLKMVSDGHKFEIIKESDFDD